MRGAVLEIVLLGVLFELYRLGRLLARGEEQAAYQHAVSAHDLERLAHLPSEAAVQGLVPADLLHLANVYYVSVHFPAMVAFLVYGFLRRSRAEYRWARNLLVALTGCALVVHVAYPLAPPRMFPQWGFVDTMAVLGPDAYAGRSGDLANQFAAMPSLHVGWAALIAYVVYRTGPRWLAVVATLHLATTLVVVVVTANHYWLDAVVALLLLAVVSVAMGPPAPRSQEQEQERAVVPHQPPDRLVTAANAGQESDQAPRTCRGRPA